MIPDTHLTSTQQTALEVMKNKFLSAIYGRDYKALESEYDLILVKAQGQPLSETDEKYLRQIQTAFKCFSPSLSKHRNIFTLTAIYDQVQTLLRDLVRIKKPSFTDYETWDKHINLEAWQKEQVFTHAVTLQLTTGCSNYCRRCNEWALPRVRAHFTHGAVVQFIKTLKRYNNTDLALYGGSDPMDWEDGEFTLAHILDNLDFPCEFSLLTKIPKGREDLVRKIAESGIPLSVSLTNRNRSRIEALEERMGSALTKQHATSDLLIPACLDEDFTSVRPSITDSYGTEISLDGANIIIPTFTSALYPFGHKKIPVTRDTDFFPVKKLGRPALLVDYFKPLEVSDETCASYYLPTLLDVQVENILLDNGSYDLTPPGMRSVKEYFEVFDEKARQQRKKMTISVMKRLKKNRLETQPYQALSQSKKQKYRDDIQAHIDFTKKEPVIAARVSAASFFLASILTYLASVQEKKIIISCLTRDEYKRRENKMQEFDDSLKNLFSDPRQSAWKIFRYLALALVNGQREGLVDEFISHWPAEYHPGLDRYIKRENLTSDPVT